MNKSIKLFTALLLAVATLTTYSQSKAPEGNTTGLAGISDGGAATYQLPVYCPAGANGLQPSFAVTYNSLAGEGPLGRGWDIAGISSITRIGKTRYFDGYDQAVSTTSDQYAIDGQRLYDRNWGAGATRDYNTQDEAFKSVAFASGTTSDGGFIVTTKGGTTLEYGNTADSRLVPTNASKAFTWYLKKVTDKGGNTIVYTYTSSNGETRLDKAEYAGNKIEFVYTSRPDVSYRLVQNSKINYKSLLQTVNVYFGAVKMRSYQLNYTTINAASRLNTLTEYNNNNVQINQVAANWKRYLSYPNSGTSVSLTCNSVPISVNPLVLMSAVKATIVLDATGQNNTVKLDYMNNSSVITSQYIGFGKDLPTCLIGWDTDNEGNMELYIQSVSTDDDNALPKLSMYRLTADSNSNFRFSLVEKKDNNEPILSVSQKNFTSYYTYQSMVNTLGNTVIISSNAVTGGGPAEVAATIKTYSPDNTGTLLSYESDVFAEPLTSAVGLGFLGFTKVTVTDHLSGNVQERTTAFDSQNRPIRFNTSNKNGFTSLGSYEKTINYYYPYQKGCYFFSFNYAGKVIETSNLPYDISTTTTSTFSSYGTLASVVSATGVHSVTTTFSNYDSYGNAATVSSSETISGQSTPTETINRTYTNGLLTKETRSGGLSDDVTTEYGYYANGALNWVKTSSPNISTSVKTYTYETNYRYVSGISTSANGKTSSVTYHHNTLGQLFEAVDDLGNKTSYAYDPWGRLKDTTTPDGRKTSTSYGTSAVTGALYSVTATAPGQPTITAHIDCLGRAIKTETKGFNNATITVDRVYNAKGQLEKQSEHYTGGTPEYTSYSYNVYGKLETVTNRGRTTRYSYSAPITSATNNDPSGLTVTVTNPDGSKTISTTNGAGQLTSATDKGGNTVNFTNGVFGPTQIAACDMVSSIGYDAKGRQTSLIDANAGTTEYGYDALNRIISQKQEGQTTAQATGATYDGFGRVDTQTTEEGSLVFKYEDDFTKQSRGALLSATLTNKTGALVHKIEAQYEPTLGRLNTSTETIGSLSFSRQYGYDTNGRVNSETYPSGFQVKYVYDTYGNLSKVTKADGSPLWTANTVNATGQVETFTLGAAIACTHSFDATHMPSGIKVGNVFDYSYAFNSTTGNLSSRTDNKRGKSESFGYDSFDRLTTVTATGLPQQKTIYMPNGNILKKTDAGTYMYPSGETGVSALYDSPGTLSSLRQNLTYTSFNKVATITQGTYTAEITYGVSQERCKMVVKKDGATVLTRYYTGNYELEVTPAGSRRIHYIGGGNGLAAIYIETLNSSGALVGTPALYYVATDHLGSIMALLNPNGTLAQEYSYDAWGRYRDPNTWNYQNFNSFGINICYRGYTGHEMLPEFGLVNMNGRMYDPVLGRFLSPDNQVQDPTNSQSYNRYSYCLNNPLRYTDPSGWSTFSVVTPDGKGGWQVSTITINDGYDASRAKYEMEKMSQEYAEFMAESQAQMVAVRQYIAEQNDLYYSKFIQPLTGGISLPDIIVRGKPGNWHVDPVTQGMAWNAVNNYQFGGNAQGGRNTYNVDAAVNSLNQNSYPSYPAAKAAGCGSSCARFIRYSLEAGFGLQRDAFLGKTPVPARAYGPFLEGAGFSPVNTTNYLPGDIAVIQGYPGGTSDANGIPYGHIQMYNGTQWLSNFYQNSFWPGGGYRTNQPAFQIYRFGTYP
ncbi:RHS repeat-associated core domain-containing protein [Gaoshiqia sp. Z1-71]|uniref:RHS repeat-associated core domain-containing protein n=1 Tax=Gaoshiqia hydrogeniformans TaxID=3290090 RepID=UPI003BF8A5EA